MGGSYNHVTITNQNDLDKQEWDQHPGGIGSLLPRNRALGMIEAYDDVWETIEEMYGMIWVLANEVAELGIEQGGSSTAAIEVEAARQNYTKGLELSPTARYKPKPMSKTVRIENVDTAISQRMRYAASYTGFSDAALARHGNQLLGVAVAVKHINSPANDVRMASVRLRTEYTFTALVED